MPQEEHKVPEWLTLLLRVWPMIVVLAGLSWSGSRYLGRKCKEWVVSLVTAAMESTKEALRRQLQEPIGDVGLEAMKATERIEDLTERIAALEAQLALIEPKVAVFWKMIERRLDDLTLPDKPHGE